MRLSFPTHYYLLFVVCSTRYVVSGQDMLRGKEYQYVGFVD